jgi:hypothetical protein
MEKIRLFIAKQMCYCPGDPDCCQAPGQSEREIEDLVKVIQQDGLRVEICDIRDIAMIEQFPRAVTLFKEYSYDAIPIIMAKDRIISYGIPDQGFIIASIRKALKMSVRN